LLQTENGTKYIYVYITVIYVYVAISNKKQNKEAQKIFLNPFTVCSSSKKKFVICPFVDVETNGRYPFENGINGLAQLYLQKRSPETVETKRCVQLISRYKNHLRRIFSCRKELPPDTVLQRLLKKLSRLRMNFKFL
jgi:hypothetical protein